MEVDIKTLKLEHQRELEVMKTEFENHIEDLENETKQTMKQILKEYNLRMAEKDREFQDTFTNAFGE